MPRTVTSRFGFRGFVRLRPQAFANAVDRVHHLRDFRQRVIEIVQIEKLRREKGNHFTLGNLAVRVRNSWAGSILSGNMATSTRPRGSGQFQAPAGITRSAWGRHSTCPFHVSSSGTNPVRGSSGSRITESRDSATASLSQGR